MFIRNPSTFSELAEKKYSGNNLDGSLRTIGSIWKKKKKKGWILHFLFNVYINCLLQHALNLLRPASPHRVGEEMTRGNNKKKKIRGESADEPRGNATNAHVQIPNWALSCPEVFFKCHSICSPPSLSCSGLFQHVPAPMSVLGNLLASYYEGQEPVRF